MFHNETYTCKKCLYVIPRQKAVISGYGGDAHGKHVHCPKCGAIVAEFLA